VAIRDAGTGQDGAQPSATLVTVEIDDMGSFRLRKADFIRNFTILSVFMAVFYAAFGYWYEAGATVISASIGIPLAWAYLRWRHAGRLQMSS
jgi:hypothetical protein